MSSLKKLPSLSKRVQHNFSADAASLQRWNNIVSQDLSEGILEIPVLEDSRTAVVEEIEQVGRDPSEEEMDWQQVSLHKASNKSFKKLKPVQVAFGRSSSQSFSKSRSSKEAAKQPIVRTSNSSRVAAMQPSVGTVKSSQVLGNEARGSKEAAKQPIVRTPNGSRVAEEQPVVRTVKSKSKSPVASPQQEIGGHESNSKKKSRDASPSSMSSNDFSSEEGERVSKTGRRATSAYDPYAYHQRVPIDGALPSSRFSPDVIKKKKKTVSAQPVLPESRQKKCGGGKKF